MTKLTEVCGVTVGGVVGNMFEDEGRNCFEADGSDVVVQIPKCVPVREAFYIAFCIRAIVGGVDFDGPHAGVFQRAQMRYGSAYQVETSCVGIGEAGLVYAGVAERIDGIVGCCDSFLEAVEKFAQFEASKQSRLGALEKVSKRFDVQSFDAEVRALDSDGASDVSVAGDDGPSSGVGDVLEQDVGRPQGFGKDEFLPGFCYLAAVEVGYRDEVAETLGSYPTFAALLLSPRIWFLSSDHLTRLRCHYVGRAVWHLRRAGSVSFGGVLSQALAAYDDFPAASLGACRDLGVGDVEYVGRVPCFADRVGADVGMCDAGLGSLSYPSSFGFPLADSAGIAGLGTIREFNISSEVGLSMLECERVTIPGLPHSLLCRDGSDSIVIDVAAIRQGNSRLVFPGSVVKVTGDVSGVADEPGNRRGLAAVVIDDLTGIGGRYWITVASSVKTNAIFLIGSAREHVVDGLVGCASSTWSITRGVALRTLVASTSAFLGLLDGETLGQIIHGSGKGEFVESDADGSDLLAET